MKMTLTRSSFWLRWRTRPGVALIVAICAYPAAVSNATEIPLSLAAIQPEQVTAAGSIALFVSRAADGGYTLWRTDGTPAGTQFVMDPCPPPCEGSSPIQILGSTRRGATYFYARDGGLPGWPTNLWISDGTSSGTHSILSASQVGSLVHPNEQTWAILGERLLFVRSTFGEAFWVTDGTAVGTVPLAGLPSPQLGDDAHVCASDPAYAFVQRSRIGEGSWIYRTTGAEDGTSEAISSSDVPLCQGSVVSGGRLWGPGSLDGGATFALWVTDGSVEGSTHSVPLPGEPRILEVTNNRAVFLLREGEDQIPSLWSSDGTEAGTTLLKQGASWESFEYFYRAEMLALMEPFVYYSYLDASGALEARRVRLDGSDDRLIQRLCDSNCGIDAERTWMERVGDTIVFPGGTPASGMQLFRLEPGTTVPTQIDTPCSFLCEFRLDFYQVLGPRLIFVYWDDLLGNEIFSFDPVLNTSQALSHFSARGPLQFPGSAPHIVVISERLLIPAREEEMEFSALFALPAFDVCRSTASDLCLRQDRFRLRATWRDFAGNEGTGQATPLTTDTGYFWFFDDANVELTVKIIDGTGLNGHYWVYYGALSNVEYWITVEDTVTGASKQYHNPLGEFGSFGDIEALPAEIPVPPSTLLSSPIARTLPVSGPVRLSEFGSSGSCVPSPSRLCVLEGRFAVEASWTDFAGASGTAFARSLTSDTGYFWFFSESNVEIVAKLVDGSALNQHFWFYYGALSNVEYTLTVTDTVGGGEPRVYRNALGQFGSFGDIEAFPAP